MNGKIKYLGQTKDARPFGVIKNENGEEYYFDSRALKSPCNFGVIYLDDDVEFTPAVNNNNGNTYAQNMTVVSHDNNLNTKLYKLLMNNYEPGETINLAPLGKKMTDAGINCRDYNCKTVKELLKQFTGLLIISDKKVSEKGTQSFATIVDNPQINQTPEQARTNHWEPELFKWAYIPNYQNTLETLKDQALAERWGYDKNDPADLSILNNYLKYTFQRLLDQENGVIETDDFAAFNTGLVDKKYKSIYAMFCKNEQYGRHENGTQKWRFQAFCVEGEQKAGKDLIHNFTILPERAQYFEKISDMLFDTKSGPLSMSNEHILIDNIDRLPETFHKRYCPNGFELKNTDNMTKNDKFKYFNNMRVAIINDKQIYLMINARLTEAINLATKKAAWNFKTAIPMYYPTDNAMSLLLPLAMTDDDTVDVALVVEKCKSGRYLGHTILTLDIAYGNARLISRPDSDWLSIEHIATKPTC